MYASQFCDKKKVVNLNHIKHTKKRGHITALMLKGIHKGVQDRHTDACIHKHTHAHTSARRDYIPDIRSCFQRESEQEREREN